MKCAVAIVLALVGMVLANPVGPIGLGIGSPYLVPSPISVGYGKVAPIISAPVTVPILKTVPIVKTQVLSAPLSIGYPGVGGISGLGIGGLGWGKGLGLGTGGLGWGNGGLGWGNAGLGWGNGGLGWGNGGLGWGGVGIGKGWH